MKNSSFFTLDSWGVGLDFAHSTHRGLFDSCVHDGPDQGLLFGLDSFIKIINEIEQEDVSHQQEENS